MKPMRIIAGLYVASIVGVGVWALVDPKGMMRTTRKTRKRAEDASGVRLPRPDIIIEGPFDQEAFDVLDSVVCESAIRVHLEHPGLVTEDPAAFADKVTKITLGDLYPDYPWPATSGDHPTAAELQGLVKYEVMRSILEDNLCLTESDANVFDEEDDEEDDHETFIPPPGG